MGEGGGAVAQEPIQAFLPPKVRGETLSVKHPEVLGSLVMACKVPINISNIRAPHPPRRASEIFSFQIIVEVLSPSVIYKEAKWIPK